MHTGESTDPENWMVFSKKTLTTISRTRDGTTIITSSYDNQICSFLVPEDLLEPREQPLTLRPHRTLQLAEPTNVVASAPYYDTRFPNTDHLLVACHEHPLQLYQALAPEQATREGDAPESGSETAAKSPIASYRFTSPTTEAYLQVHSLIWPYPGTHFLVGTRDLIAQFDITRNGYEPLNRIPTIPSRRHIRKGNGVGMRGTVSALGAQTTADDVPTGLIAAGTWTRCLGLYDIARGGECISTWSIAEAADGVAVTDPPPGWGLTMTATATATATTGTISTAVLTPGKGVGGAGINQTVWSPCGRYLVVNERLSTGMLIYDVRVTNKLLGCLAGRDALTHQRLNCDVFRGLDSVGGFEVWAGTRDGTVKVWEGVGNTEGCQWPSWDFSAVNGETPRTDVVAPALGSVGLHHSGSVVATCSGCWTVSDDEDDNPNSQTTSHEYDGVVDGDSSTSATLKSPNLRTVWRPDKRTAEESSLKLWRIGVTAPIKETAIVSEPMQVDMSVEEKDEIEKYRMRVASALETIDLDEPDAMAISASETADVRKPETAEVPTQEPVEVNNRVFVAMASEDQEVDDHRPMESSALEEKGDNESEILDTLNK